MRISEQLHLGAGQHRGALSLFPIWQPAQPRPAIQLADELSVSVRELQVPKVPWLQVTAAELPVLLLEGDVLVGGRQDRFVLRSTLLAPWQPSEVEVRCVEQERWHGEGEHVAGSRRATSYVRGNPEQGEVWERVAQEQQRAAGPPNTDGLEMLPGQCGVLIGIGGRARLMELFSDAAMLGQAWRRILEAAARDAAGAPLVRTTGHTARAFIRNVAALQPIVAGPTGLGRAVSATAGPLQLIGISLDDHILHASVLHDGIPA